MVESPPASGRGKSKVEPDEASAGTPRWVIVSGIIVAVIVVLGGIVHLAGGGFVGHLPPGAR